MGFLLTTKVRIYQYDRNISSLYKKLLLIEKWGHGKIRSVNFDMVQEQEKSYDHHLQRTKLKTNEM